MVRSLRALILAVIVMASVLGTASVASADTTPVGHLPLPARLLDITWE